MKAKAIHVKGLIFNTISEDGFKGYVVFDSPKEELGGTNGGPAPMEMVLRALTACTGMDVISILNKMKQDVRSFEVHAEGERVDEHPKVFKEIKITYIVRGKNLNPDKVKRAVELSQEKYCPVSATLKHTAKITYDIVIEEAEK